MQAGQACKVNESVTSCKSRAQSDWATSADTLIKSAAAKTHSAHFLPAIQYAHLLKKMFDGCAFDACYVTCSVI